MNSAIIKAAIAAETTYVFKDYKRLCLMPIVLYKDKDIVNVNSRKLSSYNKYLYDSVIKSDRVELSEINLREILLDLSKEFWIILLTWARLRMAVQSAKRLRAKETSITALRKRITAKSFLQREAMKPL